VQQGVPAVVAMQTAIQDEKAIQIAHEFYLSLTDGYPVDAALAEGRKAVFNNDGLAEWGTPILFMRSPDGILWENETKSDQEGTSDVEVVLPPPIGEHNKPTKTERKGLPIIAWLGGAAACLVILLYLSGIFTPPSSTEVETTDVPTLVVGDTPTHTPTSTPTQTSTLAPPAPIATYKNPVDGATYVYVPHGDFIMGSTDEQVNLVRALCRTYYDKCKAPRSEDEKPAHTVLLDEYWIMQTEVTNDQYNKFIDAGGYANEQYWSPAGWSWLTDNNIVGLRDAANTRFNAPDQPIVGVSWYEAEAYTKWLSAETGLDFSLPTEAEWEKAARGDDGRLFTWGEEWAGSAEDLANYCDRNCKKHGANKNIDDGYPVTAPVGAYPKGTSPYGALDMAGNVSEWTADWYSSDYYQESPVLLQNGLARTSASA